MQNKGAKIGFLLLIILFGIGIYWAYNYGPFANMNDEAKKAYQNYQKAEATIKSKEGNGRIGKGATTIWTVEFKDANGQVQTAEINQTTFLPKDIGEKIIIYYDSKNPNVITSEENYEDVMN